MKKSIDLTKILNVGDKVYSLMHGDGVIESMNHTLKYPIRVKFENSVRYTFTKHGFAYDDTCGECILFPSKENRDWSNYKLKMDIYVVVSIATIDGEITREIYDTAFRTKEDARAVLKSALDYWINEAKKRAGFVSNITKHAFDDHFWIVDTNDPDHFEVEYIIEKVKL